GHPWPQRCSHGIAAGSLAWSLARHRRRICRAGVHLSLFCRGLVAPLAPRSFRVVHHSQRTLSSLACAVLSPSTSLRFSADSGWRGCVSHYSQRRQLDSCSESAACESDLTNRRWSEPLTVLMP